MWRIVLGCVAVAVAFPADAADRPAFALPVACQPGLDCFVQNYVDRDPGLGAVDYTCGPLSYDGHDGTDIRVPDYVAMARGVAVIAAAAGVVLRARDGVTDVSVAETGAAALAGKEAGNGVVIDHGGGWETQYSHMRQGSVSVAPGQRLAAGDPIGMVGLSGNTEFPHLHFTVRYQGAELDPFVGQGVATGCGVPLDPLWSAGALAALAYQPGGLLNAGFATGEPDADASRHGAYAATAVAADAPALVFWVDLFGTRRGDEETIRLLAPDGSVVAEATVSLDRDRAQWFRFVGLRAPRAGWPIGDYVGTYRLVRGDAVVVDAERRLQVR